MHQFVAIGDIVTDTFIKLPEGQQAAYGASKIGSPDSNDWKLCLPFGEKIPFESAEDVHAVGNSPNASVAAAKLGLTSALVTNLGDDTDGKWCLATLKAAGVDTSLVKVHSGKLTNHHYALWYEVDRTILVKHEQYEYKLPDFPAPAWLYLSSLGESTLEYHEEIAKYLKSNPGISLAFQPGTFQINLGVDKLKDIYSRANIFFCNIQEAEKILGVDTLGTKELLKRMRDLGPKTVVLTDGPKGAYAFDGSQTIFVPVYPDGLHPYERTGAGDAFASTTVASLALGNDLTTALMWGAVNAASVVQKVGAQKGLLSRAEIEERLKTAPADFRPKIL